MVIVPTAIKCACKKSMQQPLCNPAMNFIGRRVFDIQEDMTIIITHMTYKYIRSY